MPNKRRRQDAGQPGSRQLAQHRAGGREDHLVGVVLALAVAHPGPDGQRPQPGEGQQVLLRYRERAGEDGDVQPGDDEPPPPAAAVEQHAQLGKQHSQEGVHLGQFGDERRKAGQRDAEGLFLRRGRLAFFRFLGLSPHAPQPFPRGVEAREPYRREQDQSQANDRPQPLPADDARGPGQPGPVEDPKLGGGRPAWTPIKEIVFIGVGRRGLRQITTRERR